MEQVIGFLILMALVVFFLPVSEKTKIKRIQDLNTNNVVKAKVIETIKSNIYSGEYVIKIGYKIIKIKTFICFGYTDIKDYNN